MRRTTDVVGVSQHGRRTPPLEGRLAPRDDRGDDGAGAGPASRGGRRPRLAILASARVRGGGERPLICHRLSRRDRDSTLPGYLVRGQEEGFLPPGRSIRPAAAAPPSPRPCG